MPTRLFGLATGALLAVGCLAPFRAGSTKGTPDYRFRAVVTADTTTRADTVAGTFTFVPPCALWDRVLSRGSSCIPVAIQADSGQRCSSFAILSVTAHTVAFRCGNLDISVNRSDPVARSSWTSDADHAGEPISVTPFSAAAIAADSVLEAQYESAKPNLPRVLGPFKFDLSVGSYREGGTFVLTESRTAFVSNTAWSCLPLPIGQRPLTAIFRCDNLGGKPADSVYHYTHVRIRVNLYDPRGGTVWSAQEEVTSRTCQEEEVDPNVDRLVNPHGHPAVLTVCRSTSKSQPVAGAVHVVRAARGDK